MVKMQSLLCVRCGGTLKITSSSKAVCEYCKTEYAVSGNDLPAKRNTTCENDISIRYDFKNHTVPNLDVFACAVKIQKLNIRDFWDLSMAAFLEALYWVCWSEWATPLMIDEKARKIMIYEFRNNQNNGAVQVMHAFFEKAEQEISEMPSNIKNRITAIKAMPYNVQHSLFISYASRTYEMSA